MFGADEGDLVTGLPTSVSCSILSDWVSTVDLARLDSAYCCHEQRGIVLDMFRSKEFFCKDYMPLYKIHRVSKEFWDWILRRDIKLFHITVESSAANEQKLHSYAKRHERYIGHLDLAAVESSSFSMHCKHLIQLTCDVKVDPAFEKMLQNNLSLQMLNLHGLKTKHIESFNTIRLPHLTQLRLDVRACSAELVTAMMTMPARLLKLHLSEIDTDLTGVAQHCPHLRSLGISMQHCWMEESPSFDLVEFTSHLPRLVNLQLVDIIDLDDAKLSAVVRNLKELRFLNLKFWNKCILTDIGIGHIAEHCAATLEVFGLSIWNFRAVITPVSLVLVRARCTKLRQFHIEGPYGYPTIPLGSVTVLTVYGGCEDSTLVRISSECHQLEILKLEHGTDHCTNPNLRALCQKCPKLHRIEVSKKFIPYLKGLAMSLPLLLVTERSSDFSLEVMKMPI